MTSRFSLPIKVLLIVSALALSACRNPDRFKDGDLAGAGGLGADGVTTAGLGDPSNPTSVAYFNETVGDRVLFVVDQSTVTEEARVILNGQAQWLQTNPDYAIIVEGHADEADQRAHPRRRRHPLPGDHPRDQRHPERCAVGQQGGIGQGDLGDGEEQCIPAGRARRSAQEVHPDPGGPQRRPPAA